MVAAVPEAVIGRLIAEDLGGGLDCGEINGWRERTSMRPTTMERLGIYARWESEFDFYEK